MARSFLDSVTLTNGVVQALSFDALVAGDLPAGVGTVTSVAASGPSGVFTWSSAVTSSGTLTATLATQSANTVLAGPTTGSAATPAFRSLVAADVPDLSATYAKLSAANAFTAGPNTFTPASSGAKSVLVKGAASQSVNIFEVQISSGTSYAYVDSTGAAHFGPPPSANAAFITFHGENGGVYPLGIDAAGVINWGKGGTSLGAFNIYSGGSLSYIAYNNSAVTYFAYLTSTARLQVNNQFGSASAPTTVLELNSANVNPSAGYALSVLWKGKSSTTTNQLTAEASGGWVVATHASRTGFLSLGAHDSATSEGSPRVGLRVEANGSAALISFFGVTPVVRASALTQTYSTADRTLSAYTANSQSSAYTGAADGEAKLTDLNALRTAYENLRALTEDLAQFVNSLVDDLQAYGLEQ